MGVINPTVFPGRLEVLSERMHEVKPLQPPRDRISHVLNSMEEYKRTRSLLEEKYQSYLSPLPLVLQVNNPWLRKVRLNEARYIILSFAQTLPQSPQEANIIVEWPYVMPFAELTDMDLAPAYNKMDEGTVRFIEQMRLGEGIEWLQAVISLYFPGADYEITALLSEDEEERMLGVKIYGSLSAMEFRAQRHAICRAMLAAGHNNLFDVVGIFQRRVPRGGSQVISWYSSLSTE
jgi:hypothetical protein